jgi:hypothetical protein
MDDNLPAAPAHAAAPDGATATYDTAPHDGTPTAPATARTAGGGSPDRDGRVSRDPGVRREPSAREADDDQSLAGTGR